MILKNFYILALKAVKKFLDEVVTIISNKNKTWKEEQIELLLQKNTLIQKLSVLCLHLKLSHRLVL